jgi:hypothetical protein
LLSVANQTVPSLLSKSWVIRLPGRLSLFAVLKTVKRAPSKRTRPSNVPIQR